MATSRTHRTYNYKHKNTCISKIIAFTYRSFLFYNGVRFLWQNFIIHFHWTRTVRYTHAQLTLHDNKVSPNRCISNIFFKYNICTGGPSHALHSWVQTIAIAAIGQVIQFCIHILEQIWNELNQGRRNDKWARGAGRFQRALLPIN